MLAIKIIFNAILIAALSPYFVPDSYAKGEVTYKVVKVRGPVLTRGPNSSVWSPLKPSQVLTDGDIVQVTTGGNLVIDQIGGLVGSGVKGARTRIIIDEPIVARVGEAFVRRIELSSHFLEKLPIKHQQLPTNDDLTFSDAWNRVASFVTRIPQREKMPTDLKELEESGIRLGVSARKIQLVYPVPNTVINGTVWPLEMSLVWSHPEKLKNRDYIVYAWQESEARKAPIAETSSDSYLLKLNNPGTFFVQIGSKDGSWYSEARPIHAVFGNTGVSDLGRFRDSKQQDPTPIKVYPADGTVFIADKKKKAVLFSWAGTRADKQIETTADYEVKIRNVTGKVVVVNLTTKTSTNFLVGPGDFSWTVIRKSTGEQLVKNSFRVVSRMNQPSSLIRQLIESQIESGAGEKVIELEYVDGKG